jgi:hypothetical protein
MAWKIAPLRLILLGTPLPFPKDFQTAPKDFQTAPKEAKLPVALRKWERHEPFWFFWYFCGSWFYENE